MPLRQDRVVLAAHVVAESAWVFRARGDRWRSCRLRLKPAVLVWRGRYSRTVGLSEPFDAAKG